MPLEPMNWGLLSIYGIMIINGIVVFIGLAIGFTVILQVLLFHFDSFLTSDLKNRHVSRLFLTHLQGMTEYKITKFFLTGATYSRNFRKNEFF